MRFLIIDDSSEFRGIAAGILRSHWPAADIDEWIPRKQGRVNTAIGAARYAVIVLDSRPAGEDGIDWIADIRRQDSSPPIVMITAEGSENLAVKAMKAGASDFLLKDALQRDALVRAVAEALQERQARMDDTGGKTQPSPRTIRIDVRRIGVPAGDEAVIVSGYRILRKIGEGGMAHVFLAERSADGVRLVLKILDPALRENGVFLQRFVREYKLLSEIQNEHVAQIFDQGFAGQHPYIAMEYLPGGDLKVRMANGFTSLAALRLTAQIARALDAIHSRGVIHRDLKPQNIMFRENGRPALVDFGVAKDLSRMSTLTQVGELIATPRYMSPEQCVGGPVDHRTDIYSLGAVFYELLSGQKLYASENAAGLLHMHVHGEVPKLPPRLSGYQSILARMLAKRPEDRFQSARDLFATIAV